MSMAEVLVTIKRTCGQSVGGHWCPHRAPSTLSSFVSITVIEHPDPCNFKRERVYRFIVEDQAVLERFPETWIYGEGTWFLVYLEHAGQGQDLGGAAV